MTNDSLRHLERQLEQASAEEQRIFLAHLPHVLHLEADDLSLLRTGETAFDFWDNVHDSVYDNV